jgi:KDO2-lipid IV(A) lauroyltransferase
VDAPNAPTPVDARSDPGQGRDPRARRKAERWARRGRKPQQGPGLWLRLRYRLSWVGLWCVCQVSRLFPIQTWLRIGAALGVVAHRFDTERRERALRNLRHALAGEVGKQKRRAIALEMYRNFGRLAFEYALLLSGRRLEPYDQWVTLDNPDVVERALAAKGAVVFVTCHGGNFELLGAWASRHLVKLEAVMKDLKNPYTNAAVVAMRERVGMGVIRKFPALRSILRVLRDGGSVALLCDQRRRNRGLIVDFFGRPAATVDTPAVLALRFGLPILPGFSYRVGDRLEYRAVADEPIFPDPEAPRDAEVVRMTQAVNDAIERFVRAHPEQWNWTQPRWRVSKRMRHRARRREGDEHAAAVARAEAAQAAQPTTRDSETG